VKTWFVFTPNTTQLMANPMSAAPSVSSVEGSEAIVDVDVEDGRAKTATDLNSRVLMAGP
jgi:hypothetical protein